MGHVLTSHGVKMDPEKAKAVQEMPKPEDVEGIQRINGFVNYLAKFLPGLADIMEPLRRLTRRDTEWQWTEEQEKSSAEVKKLVTAAPILSYYDPKEELVIQCDASQKGLGAALLQKGKPFILFCCLDSKRNSKRNFVAIFRQYNRLDCPLLVNVTKKKLFDKIILVSNWTTPPPHPQLEGQIPTV